MIKSMTGFGRYKEVIDGRDILCEVKSVNSRYLDASIKMPRLFSPLEDRVKQLASGYISRGKLDIYISVESITGEKINLSINKEYLDSYIKLLGEIKNEYNVIGEITLPMIASKNEVFNVRKVDDDLEAVWQAIEKVVKEAFSQFVDMRVAEGKKLQADILGNLSELERLAKLISVRALESVKVSNEKMKSRVAELMGAIPVDEARLLTECAVFADKTDINEELTRLGSHFSQFKAVFGEVVPVGRKLDFLVQELNREINTIGSKANDSEIARYVIDAKCAVERIREQIQNIE
ncbi:MAG: YicC family protein [Clostridiales bacterium GWF2_36_10]|nr:MAG: YicC family protein [Clostridiales bacterium GWF2_36_10]HAN20813.1 YicC family protein [Clostridiales bacterium]